MFRRRRKTEQFDAGAAYRALRPLLAVPWLEMPVERVGEQRDDALECRDRVDGDAQKVISGERAFCGPRVEDREILDAPATIARVGTAA